MQYDRRYHLYLWLLLAMLLMLAGCTALAQTPVSEQPILAGDPEAGRLVFQTYGCHTCHTIPGVVGANSFVGPPLTAWAERSYIAGKLPNEPAYLVQWLRFPQAIEPGSAMPNMGVTEEDAVHMAAYLYTLRRNQPWYAGMVRFLRLDNYTQSKR